MTESANTPQYSEHEIRDAFHAAHSGAVVAPEDPLAALMSELGVEENLYTVRAADIRSYLDNHIDEHGVLTEKQQQQYEINARQHIEKNTNIFHNCLIICLQAAMAETINKT